MAGLPITQTRAKDARQTISAGLFVHLAVTGVLPMTDPETRAAILVAKARSRMMIEGMTVEQIQKELLVPFLPTNIEPLRNVNDAARIMAYIAFRLANTPAAMHDAAPGWEDGT
jgi:hypothetical protein